MVMIKTDDEIIKMQEAGKLTGKVLEAVNDIIKPGITTADIDAFCEDYIVTTLDAIPGSKGQYDFPYCVNTSVNHVVCHGWPSEKQILKKGDIVNIDVTVKKHGFYGDSSKMFAVGPISPHAQRLIDITRECLYKAIKIVGPGTTLGDIGHVIQTHAEKNNYSIIIIYYGPFA